MFGSLWLNGDSCSGANVNFCTGQILYTLISLPVGLLIISLVFINKRRYGVPEGPIPDRDAFMKSAKRYFWSGVALELVAVFLRFAGGGAFFQSAYVAIDTIAIVLILTGGVRYYFGKKQLH